MGEGTGVQSAQCMVHGIVHVLCMYTEQPCSRRTALLRENRHALAGFLHVAVDLELDVPFSIEEPLHLAEVVVGDTPTWGKGAEPN